MLIKNKKDYHYEVLESIVIKYPLPWERLLPSHCVPSYNHTNTITINTRMVLQVDFALTTHPNNVDSALDGFKEYFIQYLQNKTFQRDDGIWIQYRDLVTNKQDYNSTYSVEISASPGSNARFVQWLKQSPSHFCVLHRDLGPVQKAPHNMETVMNQSCWVNPMFPDCFFIPTVLPKFVDDDDDFQTNNNNDRMNDTIIICTSGSNRDHSILAEALGEILHGNKNNHDVGSIRVHVLGRTTLDYEEEYIRNNISLPLSIKHPSYIEYHKDVIQCDILLPLITPETHPQYFDVPTKKKGTPNKKLSGVISQIIGYEKPSVVHTKLFQVYGDHMKPDHRKFVLPYTTRAEFTSGLKRLILSLRKHQ